MLIKLINNDIIKVKSKRDSIIAKYKNSLPKKPPKGGKPAIDNIVIIKCLLISLIDLFNP